jgi:hypothetical protein
MQGNPGPISTGTATQPALAQPGVSSQMKMYKDEEKGNYARPILPYPLDQIPTVLDRVRIPLLNLGSLLVQAQQNPEIVDTDRLKYFSAILDRVDKLNSDIIDLQRIVHKIHL